MKLSKEKQQQMFLVVMVSVIVLACLYYFVISSQNNAIKEKRVKIEETLDLLDKANKNVKNAPKFQADKEAIEKKLTVIEDKMLSGSDLYGAMDNRMRQFLREKEHNVQPTFSREEHVKLGLIPEFPYDALQFRVSGQGFYHDIGRFIADFENTFPYMRIQNLDLQPAEAAASDAPEKLSFRMEIVALQKAAAK